MTPRSETLIRVAAAGPGAVLVAFLSMLLLPLVLPGGRAGVDNIVVPLVAFPAIWAVLFFYACLDRRAERAGLVMLALALAGAGAIAWRMMG